MQNSQRPSCIKQLQHSPSMERRRRQSAWARARSLNDEINKPLSKRRMSEVCVIILISFTHLLTNYRGFKQPISSIYLTMLCRTASFLRPISYPWKSSVHDFNLCWNISLEVIGKHYKAPFCIAYTICNHSLLRKNI